MVNPKSLVHIYEQKFNPDPLHSSHSRMGKKDKLVAVYLLSASHRSCLTDALKDCEESCMDFFHATFSPILITRVHLYVVWQKETFARLSCHSTVTFNGSISWLVLFIFLFLFVYCFPILLSANQC